MQVNGKPYTTLWYDAAAHAVTIIDQTHLPHEFTLCQLQSLNDFCTAIADMQVRGAPLIGATAAYGFAFALLEDGDDANANYAYERLLATRPTAVNLRWALQRLWQVVKPLPATQRGPSALDAAERLRQQDRQACERIGEHGLALLSQLNAQKHTDQPLNILTHCNAGWLATVDWGTATAPIYKAHQAGIKLHVWVDETRPRNQGASLTAWELQQNGVPHTVIADNTGGHLMQQGMVDAVLVGSDRTTANGDVCNKIGTYLKALAARDNQVPFYVALPESTIDWSMTDGLANMPIEQRDSREVTHISGIDAEGKRCEVQLVANSPAANYAFDVTPARLVDALITEYGVFAPGDLPQLQATLKAAP